MQINHLSAASGRLEGEALDLASGLNLIETSDGAAWTAFLQAMLYGARNSEAEGALTLTVREPVSLRRGSASGFSAINPDTGAPIDGLTAANCGEILLGVPRGVFQRAACIGQSGADSGIPLDRRVTSLITTGEENASFTAAAEQLHRQLNTRRHNKSGLLPQTQEEIRALRSTLSEAEALNQSAAQDRAELESLRDRLLETDRLTARHDAADQADVLRSVELARLDVVSARDKVKTLEAAARAVPTRPELEALQGRLDSLSSINWNVAEARSRMDLAGRALREAEDALAAHPCAGLTPAQAASREVDASTRPRAPRWLLPVAILAGLLLGGGLMAYSHLLPMSLGSGLGIFGMILVAGSMRTQAGQQIWDEDQAQLLARRDEDVRTYKPLYEAAEKASANYQLARSAWETASAGAKSSLDAALGQLRSFRPMIRDLDEAYRALDDAFETRGELDLAVHQEAELRRHWEELRASAPPIPKDPAQRPEQTRDQLRVQRSQLLAEDETVRRRLGDTVRRMQALGDPQELSLQLQALEERRDRLQREYDSAALATEALFTANSSMQTQFSPVLGERASNIFTKLTGGQYNGVVLDGASRLPQGTIDQVYLAVRLALCETVLPEENAIPILLDNALSAFDDQPMAAALDYLLELSAQRQILLFTCQRREGDYLNWAYPDRFRHIKL